MTDLLRATDTRPYLLEQIDDAAVVQLYADGFAALPVSEKILVWHLYCAAIEGRDIYYDQRYRHNLVMRRRPRSDHHAPAGHPGAGAGGDHPLHEALLAEHGAVQQPHRAQVRAESDGSRNGRRGDAGRGERRRVAASGWGVAGGPGRAPRPDVLRRHVRSDGDEQDARSRAGTSCSPAPTISTTAWRWRTWTGSPSAIR